ncbi:MAG: acyl-CoA dehydrogenase [Cyclobacteriaceae bacterium]
MLQAPQLQANPNLYAFLPMIYMVWSDAVLTPSEIDHMQKLINKQNWLTAEEKKFLLQQVDPTAPPTPATLKSWKDEILKVSDQLEQERNLTLADIGILLAKNNANNGSAKQLDQFRNSLMEVEDALGVISRESADNLMMKGRVTATGQEKTVRHFDIDQMAAILDGKHAQLIDRVKTILSDPEFAYLDTDNLNERREKVLHWLKLLAAQGLGSIAYPKAYGGQDNMDSYFTVMETMSYHDLSLVVKYGVQFGLFGMSVYFLGTEKHHKKYLKDIGTVELPGCFAMTETGHGSNVKGIETTATYNHQSQTFTIHTPHPGAQKEYIGNAALHGQMATTFAKLIIDGTDYGVTAFLVPIRDKRGQLMPGITINDCGRKMGLNGVDNGTIQYNQVVIPFDNMLDRFASINQIGQFTSPIASDNRRFFTMLGTLVGGRIGIPRSGNAATKSALTIAIRYGDQRKQFGPEGGAEVSILNYRTHQRRLMPLLANAYALHFALQHVTERFLARKEKELQEIEALAAGLKAFTTWNTTATLQECREACGGKGYLSENRIDALKADTDIYTTFEGDNTVLMQLVAKGRLTEFKQEFANMNLFGILNYVADQAKSSIIGANPFVTGSTDPDHLLDPGFHLNAFSHREREILVSGARRLKKHLDNGMDSFDAFNQTQYHMVQVGFAYIERVILEQFQLAVKKVADAKCKKALQQLCQLFALCQIEKNKGWYLEHGYMEGTKTKAIRRLVNQLVAQVRQDAVPLVDAFKIPDVLLAAPIATGQPVKLSSS